MKICVVIAAYNERENIEPLSRRLIATLASLKDVRWEILYVIEGTDGTREIVDSLVRENPGIHCIYQEEPSGLGNAFRRGFAAIASDCDWVVTMDADLNHQPEEIPRLLERAVRSGSDVVVGSRFVSGGRTEGVPLWKRILSGTMNVFIRHLYGLSVKDKTSGFRIYRAVSLLRISFQNTDFAFLPEILIRGSRAGWKMTEEPIRFVYRTAGRSKMRIAQTCLSYLRLFFRRHRNS